MEPIVIVNSKCYDKATGDAAVNLAKACEKHGVWLCLQAADIFRASQQTDAKILAQHVDPVGYGSHSGSTTVYAVKQAGAVGTLLNHSEKRLARDDIKEAVRLCKQEGLEVVLCAESVDEAETFVEFGADYLAIELPELIGGDVSIVDADPTIVSEAVRRLGDNVLLGAGVSSHSDLTTALDGGAKGVLLASAVAKKTDDPESVLAQLIGKST